ncbi:cation diffusion facilitator family transporter [Porphyromonas canoris]|uniref:cation diffusion facilitator transporter n=1 Tax=Porphyromonas canoris TaxID=36875 RepID=UPI00051DE716|nr:cation diffusion facilitator transporter [Porphyromonas canoris]KGL50855.1 cation diffusion facilitator family transporter [Porphyromonas canoris]
MNKQDNSLLQLEDFDLVELEYKLNLDLKSQLQELEDLEYSHDEIGNPDSLGKIIMDTVWEQFTNQIGITAGEEFIIKDNNGMTLDLRNSAHIQTTENFEKGKIASHNRSINYQKRYDNWQSKFERDPEENIKTHKTRSGREEANLAKGARNIFDQGRATGSSEKGIDMDHTISAGELIRRADVNAHMSEQEQIDFANGKTNLKEMNSSHNRSKGDTPTSEWLDNPNSKGQKPREIFDDLTEEKEKQYRKNDHEARKELDKQIEKGKKESIKTGRESQIKEAMLFSGRALKAILMNLLAKLVKTIIKKLINWFRSKSKNATTLLESLKNAISEFIQDLRAHLKASFKTAITTILSAILGPIMKIFNKVWIFLKQGWKSVMQAVKYLKDPQNKNKPFGIKMGEMTKIAVAGISAGGAIILGEVIEKGLMTIPFFNIPIPLLGSLANILGLFFGALISGVLGAIIMNFVDKFIAKKKKELNTKEQIEVSNKILSTQEQLKTTAKVDLETAKESMSTSISCRHQEAEHIIRSATNNIINNTEQLANINNNDEKLMQLFSDLEKL